jgi:hypothetical protein
MAKQVISFISKFTELELVRVPRNETPTVGLQWVTSTQAVKYKFYPTLAEDGSGLVGRLDVPVGSDKLVDGNRWLAPGEEQGIERDAPTALRAHVEFGASRDFWQMPVPPPSSAARSGRPWPPWTPRRSRTSWRRSATSPTART